MRYDVVIHLETKERDGETVSMIYIAGNCINTKEDSEVNLHSMFLHLYDLESG